ARAADEREARPDAALLGGFEQERPRCARGELAVQADRRLTVGEQLADHRDHAVPGGEPGVEVLAGGRLAHARSPAAVSSVTIGSSGSTSKHACAPVWHAGPCCSTVTRIASASQSNAAAFTSWMLPLVSPLHQYSWRLRLQHLTRPSVSLRRSASRSM